MTATAPAPGTFARSVEDEADYAVIRAGAARDLGREPTPLEVEERVQRLKVFVKAARIDLAASKEEGISR